MNSIASRPSEIIFNARHVFIDIKLLLKLTVGMIFEVYFQVKKKEVKSLWEDYIVLSTEITLAVR